MKRWKLLGLIFILDLVFIIAFAQEELQFQTPYITEKELETLQVKNIEEFQKKIPEIISSIVPSVAPPIISNIKIENITENSAEISWKTNVKTKGTIAYVADEFYDTKKEDPYLIKIAIDEAKKEHKIVLMNLTPGTLYHFKIKAESLPEIISETKDFTFKTLAEKIKLQILRVGNNEIEVRWLTPKETNSYLEYKNLKTGKIYTLSEEIYTKIHSMKITNLTPATEYSIKGYGYDKKGILIETNSLTVKTKQDLTPPKISNIKFYSALIPGSDKTLIIVNWQTDEPANSIVYYEEGLGSSEPKNKIGQEDEYVLNHRLIINAKAGSIYRVKIVSFDEANNKTETQTRTVIAAKQERSIFEIMLKNFEETFRFLKRK